MALTSSDGAMFRISIRSTVIAFFLFATLVTATVAIGLQYIFSTKMAEESTLTVYQKTAASTREYLERIEGRAAAATHLLGQFTQLEGKSIHTDSIRLFAETLKRNPQFYAVYLCLSDNHSYQLINLDADKTAREQLFAKAQDKWVAITNEEQNGKLVRHLSYLNEQLITRTVRTLPVEEGVQQRPWVSEAKENEVKKTKPYLLQSLQTPGETYFTRVSGTDAVLAVDISLSSLTQFLQQQELSADSEIYLYQETGELVASNMPPGESIPLPPAPTLSLTAEQKKIVEKIPYLVVSNEIDWPPINFAAAGQPYGYAIDVLSYISEMLDIPIRYVNGLNWTELAIMFLNNELDILQPVFYDPNRQFLGNLTDPFLTVPYGVLTQKGKASVYRIEDLFGKTVAVPQGWSLANNLQDYFPAIKVIRVDGVRAMFEAVREGKVDAAIDTAPILNYTAKQFFIDDIAIHQPLDFGDVHLPTTLHFMINKSHPGLTDIFNLALSSLNEVYQQALADKWINRSSFSVRQLGAVPYKELLQITQQPLTADGLQQITLNGEEHFVYAMPFDDDVDNERQDYFAIVTPVKTVFAPGLEKVKNSVWITAAVLLLLIPLSWLLASPIVRPIYQLARDSENITQRRYNDVVGVRSRISEVSDLAGSMRNMSAAIQQHEKAQNELLDAFIKVIAAAIDDKSPHTAGHCARVPELAFMLVKEAEQQQRGPFASFAFQSKDEWREFEVAAWLHDCGKITTPEHIIEKGSKLETIYNRIHEVRMRFEVLWRDAEIDYLIRLAEPNADKQTLEQQKNKRQQQLQQDFAFIAKTNVGGESISDEDIAYLHRLGQITWQRYFDDRLGLSPAEEARLTGDKKTLPAREFLLADRPEHLIEHLHSTEYDPAYGIKMKVPEYLYNLGELHNLSIARGTLTQEDRFKINEHIISTIKMLESLPFPDELKRVPRYASTHHETMIGTGYPRKLTSDDLSVPERIMVLADIYEALTAADRPYKKAKPVSEALAILDKMVANGHVDRDVFELFLRSGVYLRYAQQFLPEEQLDVTESDVAQYLRA